MGPQLPGPRLGIYWPLAGEIDLRSLVGLSGEAPGKVSVNQWALPAVAGEPGRGRLEYRAWHPGARLEPDCCGIPSPLGPSLPPDQLGVLLVPALGIDRQGIRLGYGGGWYDRLRSDPAWRSVPCLAVVPAGCLVDALPREPWDVPLDGWLDEAGVHWLATAGPFPWRGGRPT